MNIVLPEVDGRIFTRAISFKERAQSYAASEFDAPRHAPEPSRVAFVAALAANWARLRRKPNEAKSLALILSDYPARRGRSGYAIGLDAEASAHAIVAALDEAGYDVGGAQRFARMAASFARSRRAKASSSFRSSAIARSSRRFPKVLRRASRPAGARRRTTRPA